MTDLDPDQVLVLAAQFHAVGCLPGSLPIARYSVRHHDEHEKRARLFLTGLHNAGWYLTTTKEN